MRFSIQEFKEVPKLEERIRTCTEGILCLEEQLESNKEMYRWNRTERDLLDRVSTLN